MSEQDAALASPSTRKTSVVWLDVNSRLGADLKPDLVANIQAINNSIFNLLRCPIGARGPIFQPEYGTILYRLLHDPLDPITANKLRIAFIQALQRWEPRINIDLERSSVVPNYSIAGYQVTIYYTLATSLEQGTATFLINV